VLIKIAGTLILLAAGAVLAFGAVLTIAFGGTNILSGFLRDPTMLVVLLFAALGVGLILYARHRDKLFRQSLK
jgi:hypothetical protein